MRDLAIELGYSIVFPTICRYCGQEIYLFASPDGGFAIFDDLGIPWPKHECWGVEADTPDYTSLSLEYSSNYRLPVPSDAPMAEKLGKSVKAVVVLKRIPSETAFAAEYHLYDGTQLISLWSEVDLEVGKFIEGNIEFRSGQPILKNPKNCLPGEVTTPIRSLPKGKLSATKALDVANIWDLQFDAHYMKKLDVSAGELLESALDALLSGYPLVAALVLTELVHLNSNSVSKEMKARHLQTLLGLFQELNLYSVFPKLATSLSRGTHEALDETTRRRLSHLAKLGGFKSKTDSRRYGLKDFSRQWKKEEKYAMEVQRKTGLQLINMALKLRSKL